MGLVVYLKDPLVGGGVVDGLVSGVGGVGVPTHRQDVQVRVTDPRYLPRLPVREAFK